MSPKIRVVTIGNGMVGHKFLETMAKSPNQSNFELIAFSEEPRFAYDRVHLSEFFSGKTAEDLSLVAPNFYTDNNITVYTNDKVVSIDRAEQTVTSAQGKVIPYDKLIMATGSYPFVPPVPGADRENCFVYRTIEDLEAMLEGAKGRKVGVVVGGGLLGLEAANAVKDMGLETHVVEFAPRLMAVQVDEGGGTLLKNKITELGVRVHTSKNTVDITDGDSCLHKMNFADGESLETDLILFSAGIRPQDALARESDIGIGERGGIVINNYCQTSDANIYAIGECALWNNRIFGLVAPGYQMAGIAADHIIQEKLSEFTGADMSTKLKLLGVDVASIGDAHATTPGAKCYSYIDGVNQVYKKIVVSEDNKTLLGAVMVGEAESYGNLLQLALNNIDLPENPDALILPAYDGAPVAGLGVDALPDTAQICSCNNISKGEICSAISAGTIDFGELKTCTTAGTSCGGCAALVKQVLDCELEKQGIEVNTDLCEHFPYTRQEIFHLVKVGKIKTFSELIEKHGKGLGCDICKPTASSIFASCWNDYILQEQHASLQDTNDYYLANMQKNGTYSVVPRVPGGEITPDKLIVLGEVAKKYDLYTKITGGQRIDLFGARVDQLPPIWEELIAAGFESGHAYGKAMRTVKSCVGSTWCRYGQQDSVGMAILLEERYRGIRAPHKFKLAVSGCTRECAEAQSKDIGVIATENGWNLYVCGNGGMKPRHADLLAADLDDETLVKVIDRFLMFYINTGARLQRTSTWMDNLEGGLDYLKSVVLDDKLGINAELETHMQAVVNAYQCEWKSTVEDPEKRKRFMHFINSDKTDANIVFARERQQIRPADSSANDDTKLAV